MTVEADARRYGEAFLDVDASIRLHKKLGITERWDDWEYPRRLAVLDGSKGGETVAKDQDFEDNEVIEDTDTEEVQASGGSRTMAVPRLSVTLPPELRKKIRLAAALADMEPNEWARVVLVTAAKRTVQKRFPDKV